MLPYYSEAKKEERVVVEQAADLGFSKRVFRDPLLSSVVAGAIDADRVLTAAPTVMGMWRLYKMCPSVSNTQKKPIAAFCKKKAIDALRRAIQKMPVLVCFPDNLFLGGDSEY